MLFYNCGNLTTVTIPTSIGRIDYGAFSSCKDLKEIKIAVAVTESSEGKTVMPINLESPENTFSGYSGAEERKLFFMEEGRGMTEREKEVFVAAFIRWAKKGGAFRKCCALAAIFCILIYYHVIGKHIGIAAENRAIALRGKGA